MLNNRTLTPDTYFTEKSTKERNLKIKKPSQTAQELYKILKPKPKRKSQPPKKSAKVIQKPPKRKSGYAKEKEEAKTKDSVASKTAYFFCL